MTPNMRRDWQPLNQREPKMDPWYHDVIIMVSVLAIAVCLGMCYVMIVSKVHGY